jgi:uncharacterized membrane protein YeiH
MQNLTAPITVLITAAFTLFWKRRVKSYKVTLFLFNAIGLGLFTVIGMQKGIQMNLNPGICIALVTITGSEKKSMLPLV